jgi:hypothetical protein
MVHISKYYLRAYILGVCTLSGPVGLLLIPFVNSWRFGIALAVLLFSEHWCKRDWMSTVSD